ncbi:hypothetical protein L210DRAFT_864968, partial [Boletus edulis BED1]
VVVGYDNGFEWIFNYQLEMFQEKLDHGSTGDLIIAVTAYDGPKGCTIVTGSALDGHSSMKVWGQRNEERSSQASLPFTATLHECMGVSIKQMILFAFICIIVNLAMRYLPSSIPDDIDITVMT